MISDLEISHPALDVGMSLYHSTSHTLLFQYSKKQLAWHDLPPYLKFHRRRKLLINLWNSGFFAFIFAQKKSNFFFKCMHKFICFSLPY